MDKDRLDAARYRWLRTRLAGCDEINELVEYDNTGDRLGLENDAAIDAAMAKESGNG